MINGIITNGASDNIGIHFIFDIIGDNWCQLPPSWATMGLDYEFFTKYGAWGFIHELNHHYQKYGFSLSVQNEVNNNVLAYLNIHFIFKFLLIEMNLELIL